MAIIVLKKLEDFKAIVSTANQWVFWNIEKESNELVLYASSESVYCLRLNINDPENVENWLKSNFDNVMEINSIN